MPEIEAMAMIEDESQMNFVLASREVIGFDVAQEQIFA